MGGTEERILVLTPVERDAELVVETLRSIGLGPEIRHNLHQLSDAISDGAGAVLLAEESLSSPGLDRLLRILRAQPNWSDLPMIVLCGRGRQVIRTVSGFASLLGDHANMTLLERPLRVATLLSAVRSALRARRRQYELRDFLEERRRNEERLLDTAKLESLGVLAGGIAHDFNNLLVGIMGNASLALDDVPSSDPLRPLLQNIVRASERAAELTRQLLAYSGRGRFIVGPVNLSELVRDITDLLRTSVFGAASIRLELGEVPMFEADSTQLRQLVMNLVINGMEALGESPGTVVVRTSAEWNGDSGTVVLEVTDDGCGMDEAVRARIFDPFFTTKFTGRGLGLSAAQGIVRAHGGTVEVRSEPGRGSTFLVRFPAAHAHQSLLPVTPEPALEELSSDPATVLVVDDEELVRSSARQALEHYGHTVYDAGSGRLALDMLRRRGPEIDCVLLDLTMPAMSGRDALEEILRIRPSMPVILSSGYSEAEAARRFAGSGAAAFLQKPYPAVRLARAVKQAIFSPNGPSNSAAREN